MTPAVTDRQGVIHRFDGRVPGRGVAPYKNRYGCEEAGEGTFQPVTERQAAVFKLATCGQCWPTGVVWPKAGVR